MYCIGYNNYVLNLHLCLYSIIPGNAMPYVYDFEKFLTIHKSVPDKARIHEELHSFVADYFKVPAAHVQIIEHEKLKEMTYYISVKNLKIGLNLKFLSVYNKLNDEKDSYYLVIEDLSKSEVKSNYHSMELKEKEISTEEFKEALRSSFSIFAQKASILDKHTQILSQQILKSVSSHKNFLSLDTRDIYTDAYNDNSPAVSVYRHHTIQSLNKDENITISLDLSINKQIVVKIYDVRFDEKLNVYSKEYVSTFAADFKNHAEFEVWCGKIVTQAIESVLYNCYSL